MTVEPALAELVAALPEHYQPIYGHAEWASAARRCDDRAATILTIAKAVSGIEKRRLRVLDLGCAQGYFGLTLAANGMQVHGVDVLDANVAVCNALRKEHALDATFEVARLQDHIAAIGHDTYDLVLGLSIFHHVIHSEGLVGAKELLGTLASKVPHAIFELALAEEPLHWAPSQPADVRSLLDAYSCVSELGRFPTHLSSISRPIFFASNSAWWIDGVAEKFDRWSDVSNEFFPAAHQGTRRFFFGPRSIAKRYRLDHPELGSRNLAEWKRERETLAASIDGIEFPKLLAASRAEAETWLARELVPGRTISSLILAGEPIPAPGNILRDILVQLTSLEAAGWYHDDVRTWNVIIAPDGKGRLLDFGSISRKRTDCTWPKNLVLSFLVFAREVCGAVDQKYPLRLPLLDFDKLPSPWNKAAATLLSYPEAQWSFALLQQCLAKVKDDARSDGHMVPLIAAEEAGQHLLGYIRYLDSEKDRLLRDADQTWSRRLSDVYQQNEAMAEMTSARLEEIGSAVLGALNDMRSSLESTRQEVEASKAAVQLENEQLRADLAIFAAREKDMAQAIEALTGRFASLSVERDQLFELNAALRESVQEKLDRVTEMAADRRRLQEAKRKIAATSSEYERQLAEIRAALASSRDALELSQARAASMTERIAHLEQALRPYVEAKAAAEAAQLNALAREQERRRNRMGRRYVRQGLEQALMIAIRKPALRATIRTMTRMVPPLHRRLQLFARARLNPVSSQPVAASGWVNPRVMPSDSIPPRLHVRAAELYTQLTELSKSAASR